MRVLSIWISRWLNSYLLRNTQLPKSPLLNVRADQMPWMIVRMRAGGTADSRLSHRMRDPKQYAHPIRLLVPYHAALNRAFAVASPPPQSFPPSDDRVPLQNSLMGPLFQDLWHTIARIVSFFRGKYFFT